MKMRQLSYSYITCCMRILFIFWFDFLLTNPQNCAICLQPLDSTFSIDAWGNSFHTKHENEGIFCHSCSRIISQGVTQGGYYYQDGRHLCSLCITTVINDDSTMQAAYESVLLQFYTAGILDAAKDIPISLVDIHQLNHEAGKLSHAKLKGFTRIKVINTINQSENKFHILILSGLPRIEFQAVLAHELLHIWLHQNQIRLSPEAEEGFCNLGRYLIYENDQTQFSIIHLRAMEKDPDPIYGKEYRKMKVHLKQKGWNNLISYLMYYH